MDRKSVSTFIVVLFLSGLGFAQEQKAGVIWLASSQRAVETVEQQQRPLLLYFTGKNCAWCRKLERTTWSDSKVSAMVKRNFVALKVDGAKETQLMEKLEVEGLPTIVIVAPDGKELDRIVGFVTPEEMQNALQKSVLIGKVPSSGR
ncbi:MAG: thioredoxin family protein [Planctomycetota bacterium]|nr:thioredoxin family protein [Planctomycetota bacterium]